MKLADATNYLATLTSHIIFEYNGKPCGVDPLSRDEFNMWYGTDEISVSSIDEVISAKFFDGKSLSEIWDHLTELEF